MMTSSSCPTSRLPTHNARCSETPTPELSTSPTTVPSTGFQTQPPSRTSSSQPCGTSGPTSHTPSSPLPTSEPRSSHHLPSDGDKRSEVYLFSYKAHHIPNPK